jgi:WD40 repeat protein
MQRDNGQSVPPPRPTVLAAEVLRGMAIATLRRAVLLVFTVGAVAAAGMFTRDVVAASQSDAQVAAPSGREAPATDRLGDPLPEGAIARLGTLRLRHGDMVRSLGFFPDGKTLLSADWHAVHVWDAATGRLLRRFGDARGRQFMSSAFSLDGSMAALTMDDGEISIWDARTGQRVRQFRVGRFPSVIFSPDSKILAVHDLGAGDHEALRLWDATSGTELHELRGHQDKIHQVVFSQDGKTLISTGDDKTIRFWDVATGKESRKLDCAVPVLRMAVSPDGRTLALVYGKKSEHKTPQTTIIAWASSPEVFLWDVTTGKETRCLKGHAENGVACLVFAPDSETLWTSDFRAVRSWNVRTGEQLGKLPLENAFVSVMAFTPDGKTLATGGGDQVIRLWDAKEGREKSLASGHQGPVSAVAVAPDGRTFATAGADATIRLWDRATGRERSQLVGQGRAVSALAFTADGRGLLSTGSPPFDETVRLWDIATGKELRRFAGISSVSTPEGQVLITVTKDGIVHYWELATGKEIRQWPASGGDLHLLHITPDGRTLVSWSKDQVVRLWDAATGKELRRFDGPRFEEDSYHRIYAVAVSPNGQFVAFGGQVNYLVVYDMATGKEVRRLGKLPGATSALTFSADSRFLASGDWSGGTVRLWELASGQQFQNWPGHQGRTFALSFAADSSVLVSGNVDTTALVWDLTGQIRGQATPGKTLTAAELDACWADLADADAVRAQQAVRKLAAAPAQAASYLDKCLKPVQAVDERRVARLIAALGSDEFSVREKAAAELEKLGEAAAAACRQALVKQPSAEVQHRLEAILKTQLEAWSGNSPEHLRLLRALETLEFSGTLEARQVLQRLARGAPGATLTEDARAALGRMKH